MSLENELLLRLRSDIANPNVLWVRDVVLKRGPRAWKTAAVICIGDKTTGEIKKVTFSVQTWEKSASGSFGFERKSDHRWSCEDEEIAHLQALLNANLPRDGKFLVVDEESSAALIERLTRGDASSAVELVTKLLIVPEVRQVLSESDAVATGSALIVAQRQRAALGVLDEAVNDPTSSEQALQSALDNQWWLFGGRFIGQHQRRQLTALDQLDIPLLRADGSLHVVELKKANIPRLIERYRNHYIVGPDVHSAVSQSMNYLQALDEQAAVIQQTMKFDVRRATATVVIGHHQYTAGGRTPQEVSETLRTYNSHLARVEVITYADLVDGAKAALELVDETKGAAGDTASEPAGGFSGPDPAVGGWNDVAF